MATGGRQEGSLVEGLERYSEEEQLKMALEISKNDIQALDNRRRNELDDFEQWKNASVQERLESIQQEPFHIVPQNKDSIEIQSDSEVEDEDDDELLKILEESKHKIFLSDEEKTKIALEESEKEAKQISAFSPLDENEQLEQAIKLSLGATYESLNTSSSSLNQEKKKKSQTNQDRTSLSSSDPSKIEVSLNTNQSDFSVRPKIIKEKESNSSKRMGSPRKLVSPPKFSHTNDDVKLPQVNLPKTSRGIESDCVVNVNRYMPLSTANTDLSEDEQMEIALKRSKEEAERLKAGANVGNMSEEEQVRLAMQLSRSESAHTVPESSYKTNNKSKNTLKPLAPSQSSPNVHHPYQDDKRQKNLAASEDHSKKSTNDASIKLRLIVVDGSNVGMAMGKKQVVNGKWQPVFSAQALSIVYAYFASRKHEVVILLPRSRWNRASEQDRKLLDTLERKGILCYTPSRRTESACWDSYDDRVIVEHAAAKQGIILTNDNYRDLIGEGPVFKEQIEKRLLPYSFVGDSFYPAFDPLGKNGPKMDEFLRH